jgi:citronellol/citronellal dehydrogenase
MRDPLTPDPLAAGPFASAFAPGLLDGRVALVTGGGSGIGRAAACQLAALGARVAVVGRRPEPLAAVVDAIHAHLGADPDQPVAMAVSADVREPEQVDRALDEVLGAWDRVDILVNNAGGQFVAPAEGISYNGFRAVTRLNLDATWYMTVQVAVRSMIPHGYGKVVSVVMSPRRAMPGMSHSSAARAAVESLTRTLAVEWGRHGIRINALAPGIIHTDAWERYGLQPADVARVIPAGALGTAEQVADSIVFLSTPASDYVTGATLLCDGGLDQTGPGADWGR